MRIWSRIGRRPALAGGNSNGDIPMLRFADGLRLLVLHDDAEREFDYTTGAEDALAQGGPRSASRTTGRRSSRTSRELVPAWLRGYQRVGCGRTSSPAS